MAQAGPGRQAFTTSLSSTIRQRKKPLPSTNTKLFLRQRIDAPAARSTGSELSTAQRRSNQQNAQPFVGSSNI